MGFGYLETQQKIQVHYLMWLATSVVFSLGVVAFIWDFAAAGPPRARCQSEGVTAPRPIRELSAPELERRAGARARLGGALLPAARRRDRGLHRRAPPALADHAQGADRLRQDALRSPHGVAARTPARHGRLPRRPFRQRSHRPLPGARRRDRVAGRPADARRAEPARSAISTRSSRRARTRSSSSIR